MSSNGVWSPSRPASWWGRALCLWLCTALLLIPSPIFGQNPTERLSSIEQRLLNIISYSVQLEKQLKDSQQISEEQQRHIEHLLIELAGLRHELAQQSRELESSNASLESYRLQVVELLNIIDGLERRLQQLSETCENIAQPLREVLKMAEKEIRRQKIEKWLFAFLAGAATGYFGHRIGRLTR